jgi:hypothetical protein
MWRKYILAAFHSTVTSHFHNNPEPGHSRVLRTGKVESEDVWSPEMKSDIGTYVVGCDLYH